MVVQAVFAWVEARRARLVVPFRTVALASHVGPCSARPSPR